ncbi:PREDICTED: SRR1-like protein [Nanorana parkeri]|uniref:SRR1-like protein n=1 Tax=Nanorana parkeri TaxID=125878 RepID=UPI000854E5B6|nr:PREDICTED: SRR1-like protein [Nanorana parkeri]
MESGDWQVVSKRKTGKKSQRIKENSLCKAKGSAPFTGWALPQCQVYVGYRKYTSFFLKKHFCKTCRKLTLSLLNSQQNMFWIQELAAVADLVENLRISDFWKSCQGCLHKCQNIASAVSKDNSDAGELIKNSCLEENVPSHRCLQDYECVCYGLGNFVSCVISRHQLAFLLLFLEQFKIPRQQCNVFDPIFSTLEISVLQELDLKVIFKNEEGKHAVQKPTVFYMLHCGKALYNNLLWRNWSVEALSQMIIIGNSFRGIEERLLSRILQRDYTYIYKSLQAVKETAFPECPEYSDIFNDTSIHSFPLAKLQTFPEDLWQLPEEPQYQESDDLEIVRNLTI